MANFLAPVINSQQEDANGNPLSGGSIEVYLAGTSTPATTYSTQAGVPNAWPIVLNVLGVNNQGAVWLTGGAAYKYVIKNSVGVVQRTIDNVSGINDTVVTNDQWVVYQAAPTYVSATSFTVAGDQTQIFQINRRVRTTNTGGTVYSTITNSVYGAPNTTVTVRNDSGTLDAGLSQVSYGIISSQNSSVTGLLLNVQTFTANGTYTPTVGTTKVVVEVIGGGGGGGGGSAGAANFGGGGGGGGGGYAMGLLTSGFSGAAVVVGSAGTGVAGVAGNGGGPSSFAGAVLGATGGGGGAGAGFNAANLGAGGLPGVGSGTGANLAVAQGGPGATGIALAAGTVVSGAGGSSFLGGGPLGLVSGSVAGTSATTRGAGGSGATTATGNVTNITGGSGQAGYVRVWEYA